MIDSTSAGINPARDLGPRLVTLFGHWGAASMTNWLPYVIGPFIGGPIGAFVADRVLLL
jgi:glycerol uptake facilitator protein